MKKHAFLALALAFIMILCFCGCFFSKENKDIAASAAPFCEIPGFDSSPFSQISGSTGSDASNMPSNAYQYRAVWLSYMDLTALLKNKTEAEFREGFQEVIYNCKSMKLNRLLVQVRPFADAFYKSSVFPWSHLLTGEQGKDPGFDPLQVICAMAKENSLAIEAWINPFRISTGSVPLNESSIAYRYFNQPEEYPGYVIQVGDGLYFNPAVEEVRSLIIQGVTEIVKNYDVDGIHMDDYFYPTTAESFDETQYKAYTDSGGKLALADWRRENVNILIKGVYNAVKAEKQQVVFGISPGGNLDVNRNQLYADIATWCANSGYIDYICPQIYYGFENKSKPFAETVEQWQAVKSNPDIHLYIGLAAYKAGKEDVYAGEGKSEWIEHTDMLKQMLAFIGEKSGIDGFAMYDYKSLAADSSHIKQEIENMTSILP